MKRQPKIALIVGNRPQFIKAAPLLRALAGKARTVLIHTGQHYDLNMSEVFFRELHIRQPDHNLGVGSGSHADQIARMLVGLDKLLGREAPDLVVVFGDTNSTLASAIVTARRNLPLAHVEAGMRSFDFTMPEEQNRIVADRLSQLLFCASPEAVKNLAAEGRRTGVYPVGDNQIDTLMLTLTVARKRSRILKRLSLSPHRYLLATIHRASNTDSKANLVALLSAFERANEPVVFPVHPRTTSALKRFGLLQRARQMPNLILTDPVGYIDMVQLMENARRILTDSGGVQKEAFTLKVPCVTLRTTTEWVETVRQRWNVLVGNDTDRVARAARSRAVPKRHVPVYGDGHASVRIAHYLLAYLRRT